MRQDCVIIMLTVLNNGKPHYYPRPDLKIKICILWAIFYGVIWAALGSILALGSMTLHLVVFPLAYTTSRKFRCSFTYFHYVQTPFLKHGNPKDFGLHGARNLYTSHQSKVDNCKIELGLWHVLPKSVYEKNKENIESADKQELNALFDEELMNTEVPVVLYCHGITKSRGFFHRVELYNLLQDLNMHVISFDYRGFADSTLIVPTKMGMVEDTLTVYSWIRNLVGADKPVFVWAHSMGTCIALKSFSEPDGTSKGLSRERLPQPQGLILEGSFNNIYEAMDHFPFAKLFNWMPHYYVTMVRSITRCAEVRLLPEDYVRTLTTPVLMLHSKDDDIVPYLLATKLYGHISKSRMNDQERPIFKMFLSGGHMLICRERKLPGIIREFIDKFKGYNCISKVTQTSQNSLHNTQYESLCSPTEE